jgi:bis(5'-nucleosyl)-tetraphosphatase (symmetrical)
VAIYAVGDIQGCFDELRVLLDRLNFDTGNDQLWLVGDLVNRGPKSLETLRFIKDMGKSAVTVLGNHDLHLLAQALAPEARPAEKDLQKVLRAKDSDDLIGWLLQLPLMHFDNDLNTALVHAGIYPEWSLKKARKMAKEVENVLQGNQAAEFLGNMYGSKPDRWSKELQGQKRLRFIVNSFTRMRYCRPDASLDFSAKLAPVHTGLLRKKQCAGAGHRVRLGWPADRSPTRRPYRSYSGTQPSAETVLDSYRRRNVRMKFIANNLEIIKGITTDVVRMPLDSQPGQR